MQTDPRGNADILLVADASELADPVRVSSRRPRILRKTRNPRKPSGYRALSPENPQREDAAKPSDKFEVDPSALSLYDGNESLLVRTALIRSKDWRAGLRSPRVLTSSNDAARICRHLAFSAKEYAVVLVLDSRQRVIAIHETGVGGSGSAEVDTASLLQAVLLANGQGFVLVHNHPSGIPTPSEDDVRLTRHLAESAKCVGVAMIDSVIVGMDGHASFLDLGLM